MPHVPRTLKPVPDDPMPLINQVLEHPVERGRAIKVPQGVDAS
jgi:hypothetical protein